MSPELLTELRYMARSIEESGEDAWAKRLYSAADKLRNEQPLTAEERKDVLDEFWDWLSKDHFVCDKKARRQLYLALHEMGDLERFDPEVVCSRRQETITIKGVKYVVR